jgi:diguanylate cyclase (GGDEF)-like protein
MYDGEQSAAFMTLLDTKADYHAQPPQPNSFAGKDMQYLAVPFYGDDGEISLILQVGNSSDQYDKSLQAMNPEKLFSDVIIRKTGYVVVLDKDTNEVIYPPVADTRVRESKWQGGFDTDDTLGFFAENVIYESKIVGNVRVIAVLPAKEAYAERPELLGLLFATFAAFFIVITFALNRFLHRRLIQPLSGIIVSMNNLLDIGKVASASETDVFEIKSLNENIKRLKEEVNIRIETLEELGFQDTLTEIPNRLSLNYRAASEFGRVKREKFPISVIMIDIDNFKVFNDTYGHPAGDKLLREVAQTVSKTLKRAADFAARYGGEEFCVLLPNTSLKGAETVAELIRRNVDTNEFFPDGDKATISLGVATYDPSQSALEHTSYEIKFEQLLEKADKALYFAKKAGKNRVCLWEF